MNCSRRCGGDAALLVVAVAEVVSAVVVVDGVAVVKLRPLFLPALTGSILLFGRLVPAAEMHAKMLESTSLPRPSEASGSFQAGSGLGVFQDIQVPLSESAGMRADGKAVGTEHADHLGTALYLGWLHRIGNPSRMVFEVDGQYLTMRATSGPAETQSSTYSRFNLMAGTRYALGDATWRPTMMAHIVLRRSEFDNVSNGHYVNSAALRTGIGLWRRDLTVDAYASYAPWTEMGFNDGRSLFGGERFASGRASLVEFGLGIAYHLSGNVWLDLAAEQEIIAVRGNLGADYVGFGLSVERSEAGPREYDMATTVGRLGIRKQF